MVQKQLRQETEVLTVDLVELAIHFKDAQVPIPIDLVARWMP